MENNEDNRFLGEERISKLLFKFAIPCILSLLISSLYNIVDQIFIGNYQDLKYLGNAATSVVFPITIIAVAFAWCFGDGSAAYLSLCQGRKDTSKVHKAIGNSLLITFFISLLIVIIGFSFRDSLLYLFGASIESISLARAYFNIILTFIPIYMMGNVMSPIMRADGSPKFAMLSTLSGAVINIILDPLFIYGFHWGIEGAAWATIIGQIFSFLIAVLYFRRTKTFQLHFESFKWDGKLLGNVIKLGISTFITQMSIVIVSLVCNMMLKTYGEQSVYGIDIPMAVMGICMKVFTIVINIVVGIILGAQPILGYNFGAKKFDRVRKTFRLVLRTTILVGVVATLVFEFSPQIIIRLFGTESELYMDFAQMTFRIFLLFVTFTCTIKMISIFFQAVGEPVKSAAVSLMRDIVCFIPLVLLLPRQMGIKGVLWAAPVADSIGIVITLLLTVTFFHKLPKEDTVTESDGLKILPSRKGVIITIAREHGSQGKFIGELVAKELAIPYYDKELTAIAAEESGLDKEFLSKISEKENSLYQLYLTTEPVKYAIEAQEQVIQKIALEGSCVIVGRAADYVLRKQNSLIRIFIYADKDYRIKNVMKMYGDNRGNAKKHIERSDRARAHYYEIISGKNWKEWTNYDLCINSSIGAEATARTICDYVKKRQEK